MKKSLLVASVSLAALMGHSAAALIAGRDRTIHVDGLDATLGTATFTALGASGAFCDYLLEWNGPFNPNDISVCVAHELRQPFAPSCIVNERLDIVSAVTVGVTEQCIGSNLKGEDIPAQLLLGEGPGGLTGIAFLTGCAVPTVYPVSVPAGCTETACSCSHPCGDGCGSCCGTVIEHP